MSPRRLRAQRRSEAAVGSRDVPQCSGMGGRVRLELGTANWIHPAGAQECSAVLLGLGCSDQTTAPQLTQESGNEHLPPENQHMQPPASNFSPHTDPARALPGSARSIGAALLNASFVSRGLNPLSLRFPAEVSESPTPARRRRPLDPAQSPSCFHI